MYARVIFSSGRRTVMQGGRRYNSTTSDVISLTRCGSVKVAISPATAALGSFENSLATASNHQGNTFAGAMALAVAVTGSTYLTTSCSETSSSSERN